MYDNKYNINKQGIHDMKMTTLLTYLSGKLSESQNEQTIYDQGLEVIRFDSESTDYHVSIHDVDSIELDDPKTIQGSVSQKLIIKQGDNTIEIILFMK